MKNKNYIRINKIRINKIGQGSRFQISSNLDFIKVDSVICEIYDTYIVIALPDIDFMGKTHAPQTPTSKKWRMFSVVDSRLKCGVFEISDESDEDELIIYY